MDGDQLETLAAWLGPSRVSSVQLSSFVAEKRSVSLQMWQAHSKNHDKMCNKSSQKYNTDQRVLIRAYVGLIAGCGAIKRLHNFICKSGNQTSARGNCCAVERRFERLSKSEASTAPHDLIALSRDGKRIFIGALRRLFLLLLLSY